MVLKRKINKHLISYKALHKYFSWKIERYIYACTQNVPCVNRNKNIVNNDNRHKFIHNRRQNIG